MFGVEYPSERAGGGLGFDGRLGGGSEQERQTAGRREGEEDAGFMSGM